MIRLILLALPFIFANVAHSNSRQCPDLYERCDLWKSQTERPLFEPIWNRWLEARGNLVAQVHRVLANSPDNWAPNKMFKSCMNTAELERKGLKRLKLLLRNKWPLLQNDTKNNLPWLNTLLTLHKFGAKTLVNIHVSPNMYQPKKYVLYMEPGSRFLPEGAENHYRNYGKWIYAVARVLGVSKRGLEEQVLDILRLESKLTSLSLNSKDSHTSTTIGRLSTVCPTLQKYINFLLQDANVKVTSSTTILVKSVKYLRDLAKLLEGTSQRTVANYLGWCLFLELSRDTVQSLRRLSFLVDKAVLGVEQDLPREVECVQNVMDRMGLALAGKIHIPENSEEFVRDIFRSVQSEFKSVLNETEWMSVHTKLETMRKIDNVKAVVSFPKWIKDDRTIANYYVNLSVDDDHLTNVVKWKLWKRNKEFLLLRKSVNVTELIFNPFEVNVFYSVLQNAIIFPVTILQEPFLSLNYSIAQNYGAIGSLIGHELSHALDITGRHFNPSGQKTEWWTSSEVSAYTERLKCFLKQYRQAGISATETLGENIADTVGLLLSYRALLKKYHRLTYKDEQQFFHSFAMQWCEISNFEVELLVDEHAPVSLRVLSAASNVPGFHRAFNCLPERDYCKLW